MKEFRKLSSLKSKVRISFEGSQITKNPTLYLAIAFDAIEP